MEELRHELMVTKASERYNAEYARAFELERNKALEELAYVRLQRDKLLEITWLDLPGEPDESTARWRELFEAGWVRRVEAAAEQGGATNHIRDKQFAPAHGSASERTLRACPFCGGAAEIDTQQGYRAMRTGNIGTSIAIYCTKCPASMSICREDVPDIEPEWLVGEWNRRADEGKTPNV